MDRGALGRNFGGIWKEEKEDARRRIRGEEGLSVYIYNRLGRRVNCDSPFSLGFILTTLQLDLSLNMCVKSAFLPSLPPEFLLI